MGCDKKADSFTPVRKSHKTVTDEHDYDDSFDICDKPCLASAAPILSKLSKTKFSLQGCGWFSDGGLYFTNLKYSTNLQRQTHPT